MGQWTIKRKLLTLILSTLVAFGTFGGYLLTRQASVVGDMQGLYDQDYRAASLIGEIDGLLTRVDINILRMIAIGDPASIAAWKAQNTERFNKVEQLLADLRGVAAPSMVSSIAVLTDAYGRMRKGMEHQVQAVEAGDVKAGGEINKSEVKDNADKTFSTLAELKSMQDAAAKSKIEAQLSAAASTRTTTVSGVLLVMTLVLGMGLLVVRDLMRQLGGEPGYAAEIASKIATGDLTADVRVATGDNHSLLAAMKVMRDSLVTVVSKVRSSSDSIANGSTEIANGNADLSQRTEEQASNLQQTAASMEQLSGTVRANAETAAQANVLAAQASESAVKGGEVVGSVVVTMQDIANSSKKISDIIGVIDGIAFQTNILALNAAVEAARAGEQGRGFAVVASEVRSLAGRSADAAKEIKLLINASVEKVEAGTRQVDAAGVSMGEIVNRVQRVTQMMTEISSASAEQTTGISQVGDAIQQLDQVTQQNASLVEESAAAAESLKAQAQQLVEAVAVFKLMGNGVTGMDHVGSSVPASMAARQAPPAYVKNATRAVTKAEFANNLIGVKVSGAEASKRVAITSNSDDWASF